MNVSKPREVPAAVAQLRGEIEQLPQDDSGIRRDIPEDLKRRAVAEVKRSGMTGGEFAAAILIAPSTLCRWSREYREAAVDSGNKKRAAGRSQLSGFKRVSVLPEPAAVPRPASTITIEGPGGMRITGLQAEDVARLWRALC